MEFIITKKKLDQKGIISQGEFLTVGEYELHISENQCKCLQLSDQTSIFILGDCINSYEISRAGKIHDDLMKNLKGLFTLISVSQDRFSIYNSMFGFLPVYHTADFSSIASSPELIRDAENLPNNINKRFILESFLFNYPFLNTTVVNDVSLLDSFTAVTCDNGRVQTHRYFDICQWFTSKAVNGENKLPELATLFIDQMKQYFDVEKNSVTFTGGFDGRSIVAAGLSHGCSFETFSMGRPENEDVLNPLRNAQTLNIPYHFYDLGDEEYLASYNDMAVKMSNLSNGFNGFLYAHFLYGIKKEARENKVLLTGYCGSELFRALHIQGAVTSQDLVLIFTEPDDEKLKIQLWNSAKLSFIVKSEFKQEFENLFEEIIAFRKNRNKFSSINHFFYSYIYSEVFRKVFGSWSVAQFPDIKVRVPFLDFDFINELMKTDIAGCNNEFFIHNPFKRLKGQLLYAEIIRQSCPVLYCLYTEKGYRPCDLMTLQGKVRIVWPYMKKKLVRKILKPNLDNLGLVSAYINHQTDIEKTFQRLDGFYTEKLIHASRNLSPFTPEAERDMIFQSASLASINNE
jgi:hypothetical protein